MLEKYIQKFLNLRTDRGKHRYPALTMHRAPHKPFLLLSVMDLIAQGIITRNFIEPSLDLLETFNMYWSLVMPVGSKTTMAHPFPRLQTDGFWHRIATAGWRLALGLVAGLPRQPESVIVISNSIKQWSPGLVLPFQPEPFVWVYAILPRCHSCAAGSAKNPVYWQILLKASTLCPP